MDMLWGKTGEQFGAARGFPNTSSEASLAPGTIKWRSSQTQAVDLSVWQTFVEEY